jgi:hypothetical protein
VSDKPKVLSASKIKTLQSCSWLYWCKYHLKLPDSTNDGCSRGTICHAVFECLGNPRHKRHYHNILKKGSIEGSKSVVRMVKQRARDLNVDDEQNLTLMDEMILNGLHYDFFGDTKAKPTKAISEKDFSIYVDEDGKKYAIRGFIDKLFLYSRKKRAIIRDFKTSKKVFQGKERVDNLQDLMYSLAVKHLYPKYLSRQSEFLFLKFSLEEDLFGETAEGVVKMKEVSDEELEGFEYYLTEVQKVVDSFSETNASENFAAKQEYPKDGSFGGPLSCGFAKKIGQLKKDGTKMWHCSYKFGFDYWRLVNENGETIRCAFKEDKQELIPDESKGERVIKEEYGGCPHWKPKTESASFPF